MKHRSYFLLVSTLFFYFTAGFYSPGERIWDKQKENPYEEDAKHRTSGCTANMRLFGPDNQYRCNCKYLRACNFGKNGKCKDDTCKFGFVGSFCQRIRYDHYQKTNNKKRTKEYMFSGVKKINKSMFISFDYKYRINFVNMHCQTSDPSVTVTLHIDSTEFCNKKCSQIFKCSGDEIGRNMSITITGNNPIVSLSKMKLSGCSPFWFGRHCDKQCHCVNNEECHKFTGKCPNGCEKGRSGSGCQKLNYENVALNKRTSQINILGRSKILENNTCTDVDYQFSSNLAVDGNIDQQFERHSCINTIPGRPAKWTVYLRKTYNISQIRIYHENNQLERFINAVIYVGGHKCYKIKEAKKIHDVKCDSVIAGENITISIKGDERYLHVCEVEVLQCLPGFYGDRCSQICSKCKRSSCDQWTGRCVSGCVAGYWQNDIKMICEVCPDGKFGEHCLQTCHCKNNAKCDKKNGTCGSEGCAAGYKGNNCQETCSDGKFGENCLQTCHCKNNVKCDKKNGTCGSEGCAAGYKRNNCQEICPDGKFGDNCLQTCHCKNNTNCDERNGTCGFEGCAVGYKGNNCQYFNILIPIGIGLSALLVINSGIFICLVIKSKKKDDKTSVSQQNVSLPETIRMKFVKDNDDEKEDLQPLEDQECPYISSESVMPKKPFLLGEVKYNDDEHQVPLEKRESLNMNSKSVIPKPSFLQRKVKDTGDEYQVPLEKRESLYMNSKSVIPKPSFLQRKVKDTGDEYQVPLEKRESLYMNSKSVIPKPSFLQRKVKDTGDEYQVPLEKRESLYMNSKSVIPKPSFLQRKVKDTGDEYQVPLEKRESLYMNSKSVIPKPSFLQGKVKDEQEPLEEQEHIYLELI